MFSHVGAASVTFERRDRFQKELLSGSDHSPAREIDALRHALHVMAQRGILKPLSASGRSLERGLLCFSEMSNEDLTPFL